MTEEKPSYEEAREELVGVVTRLEAGGTSLEDSLALWERGEKLATICQDWLDGARVVGISSGASAPEELVTKLVEYFRERGTEDVSEFEVMREDVRFMLPKTIRQAMTAAGAA